MKERIIVLNGTVILQFEQDYEWKNKKVFKAGNIKPGLYDLYLAKEPNKNSILKGKILFRDKEFTYQTTDLGLIKYKNSSLTFKVELYVTYSLQYTTGKVSIADSKSLMPII